VPGKDVDFKLLNDVGRDAMVPDLCKHHAARNAGGPSKGRKKNRLLDTVALSPLQDPGCHKVLLEY